MTTIPKISELYADVLADLEYEYGFTISLIKKIVLRAVAAVQAGKLYLLYLALANLQKNIFVDTAESESTGGTLERFGRVKLGRNPFPAVQGKYVIQVTGDIGAVIEAQTTFKSDDDSLNPGVLYVLDTEYTLVSSTDSITVRALTSGEGGKLNTGNTLTATAPIALVDSEATVLSESVQPLAAEDIEVYRTAIINSYRLEAQGGSANDYRLWSQDAQGVQKVYPYAKSGACSEVNLYVEATTTDSSDGKGTPTAAILTAVEDVVNLNPDTSLDILERGRRPLQVIVYYLPVTIKTIDITISGYSGITDAIKAALLTAITTEINTIRPFVSAADTLSLKNDILDVNKLIGTIVQTQPGAIFTSATFTVDSVAKTTYTFENGDIPYLNSITYT